MWLRQKNKNDLDFQCHNLNVGQFSFICENWLI
jgi:hypothetical protein